MAQTVAGAYRSKMPANRYTVAHHDFRDAICYLDAVAELDRTLTVASSDALFGVNSLLAKAVAAYSGPFRQGKSEGITFDPIETDPALLFHAAPKHMGLHEEILGLSITPFSRPDSEHMDIADFREMAAHMMCYALERQSHAYSQVAHRPISLRSPPPR